MTGVLKLGNCKHGVVGPFHRPPGFQEKIQTREMHPDRSSGGRHVHPWMLYRIGIHSEPVKSRKSIVAVFSCQDFAVGRPTAWRRQHVFMRRAIDLGELRLTSYATHS